jgi:AAA15 family ATPase/GTPase
MLNSLYIKNFRLFQELQIERLGRINLFVGKNNSGKTCLLEALHLYADKSLPDNHFPLRYLFHGYHLPKSESEGIEIGPIQPLQERLKLRLIDTEAVIIVKANEALKLNVQGVPTDPLNNEKVVVLWDNLNAQPTLRKAVCQGLQLIDEKIQELVLEEDTRKPILIYHDFEERLPLENLGDGLTHLFHLILALVNAQDGFLLIDEFENGLHYTVQPKVWELIFNLAKKLNVQVFATTHSWDGVKAFQQTSQQSEEEVMLFRLGRSVRKSDNGKVIAIAYSREKLQIVAETTMEVRG